MFPTQAQFWAWIDSYRHKDEKVPVSDIEGLNELFTPVNSHFNDPNAHPELFDAILENNTIITDNGFTKEANLFTGLVDSLWNINGVRYTNPVLFEDSIELCSSGKVRMDRMVLDTNNSFFRVVGDEYDSNPVPQSKPINTLDYTFIPVSDTEVGTPTPPLLGANFVKKTDSKVTFFTRDGSNVVIPFDPNGYSEIRLTNPGLVSVSGMDLSLITGNPSAENPYTGKSFHFVNLTGNNIVFKQLDVLIAEYPFLNKLGIDLVFPNGEKIEVKFDAGGLYEFDISWKSKLIGEIQLPAYTSARNDGPNPNNKVLNVDASGNLKLHSMPILPPPYLEELIPDSNLPDTTGNFIIRGSFFTPTTTVTVEDQTLNYLTFVSDNEMIANITTGSDEGTFGLTINNGVSVNFHDVLLVVSGDVLKPTSTDWETLGDLDFSTDGEAKIVTLNLEVSANVKETSFTAVNSEDYRIQWKWAVSPLEDGSGYINGYGGDRQYVALRRVSDDAIIYSLSMNNFPGSPVHMRFTVDGTLATAWNSDVATETAQVYSFRKIGSNWYLYINGTLLNSPAYFESGDMYFEVRNRVFDTTNIKLITLT